MLFGYESLPGALLPDEIPIATKTIVTEVNNIIDRYYRSGKGFTKISIIPGGSLRVIDDVFDLNLLENY